MNWLLAAALCVALVEMFMALPLAAPLRALTRSAGKAARVVSAKGVSDHWKEKAMGAYARATFAATGRLALLLGLIFAAAYALVLLFDAVSGGFEAFLLSWTGIIATLVLATGYAVARRKLGGASDYSALDKLLHRAALGARPIAEMSFDLDQGQAKPDVAAVRAGRHVFVTGLARAGTTILMRRIHGGGGFRSLTYRDMPFVLAPNLWGAKIGAAKAGTEAAERAHGDRIKVSVDSPESLDEVFWRVFDGESYIAPDHLLPHRPDEELRGRFAAYVGAILKSGGGSRYLSKNNNNVLRLPALRATFPEALILVPFRDPLTHARSLMRQHENFLDQQRGDPFVASYMTWLGHHEFGRDHRPFRFGDAEAARLAALDPGTLDYWLEVWRQTYAHVEQTAPADAIFVCYETLCEDPSVWERLAGIVGVEGGSDEEPFSLGRGAQAEGVSPAALEEARAIYDRLARRAADALG
ncbi:sulfotransferase [Rhodovulum sp. DZ06]|uniref:sulfotransferase n=1 Tax=Rhodovulum sp. DZ06 TaxID=3425126 RepID=UPI003D32A658